MKHPCNKCPFKKDSFPGYLGTMSGNPIGFLNHTEQHPMPCHMQVKDEEWKDKNLLFVKAWKTPCIGLLQFMKNTGKLPRHPYYASMVGQVVGSIKVFATRQEFIKYHEAELYWAKNEGQQNDID